MARIPRAPTWWTPARLPIAHRMGNMSPDQLQHLERLAVLRAQGAITEAEFQSQKQSCLDPIGPTHTPVAATPGVLPGPTAAEMTGSPLQTSLVTMSWKKWTMIGVASLLGLWLAATAIWGGSLPGMFYKLHKGTSFAEASAILGPPTEGSGGGSDGRVAAWRAQDHVENSSTIRLRQCVLGFNGKDQLTIANVIEVYTNPDG